MSKSASIPVRHGGPELKEEAKSIFEKIGLALSSAVSYFSSKSRARIVPHLDNDIPNRATRKVIRDTRKGKNLIAFENEEEVFKFLDI
jgi:antitoxin component of RelBE/YafQ-DinJ toxin-antitoxin module